METRITRYHLFRFFSGVVCSCNLLGFDRPIRSSDYVPLVSQGKGGTWTLRPCYVKVRDTHLILHLNTLPFLLCALYSFCWLLLSYLGLNYINAISFFIRGIIEEGVVAFWASMIS